MAKHAYPNSENRSNVSGKRIHDSIKIVFLIKLRESRLKIYFKETKTAISIP
jgi:hypothetical protein